MQFISASDLERHFDWPSLIECLRGAFRSDCQAPVRHHHTVPVSGAPDATLLLMPAWIQDDVLGVKIATVFPGNARQGLPAVTGTYLLASAHTGEVLALLDGSALTLWRTAAASALAASYLASPDASCLLMVGTGRLAPNLVAAHAAGRDLREVRIWGRHREKAERLAQSIATTRAWGGGHGAVEVRAVADLEDAAASADIISCATLTTDPLIHGAWLKPGAHVDLVGGFTPAMREADDAAITRASVFVDTRAGATKEAGDIVQPLRSGVLREADIQADLFDLARGTHPGRRRGDEITLFKSVGTALEDLAAARLAWERSAGEVQGLSR